MCIHILYNTQKINDNKGDEEKTLTIKYFENCTLIERWMNLNDQISIT